MREEIISEKKEKAEGMNIMTGAPSYALKLGFRKLSFKREIMVNAGKDRGRDRHGGGGGSKAERRLGSLLT